MFQERAVRAAEGAVPDTLGSPCTGGERALSGEQTVAVLDPVAALIQLRRLRFYRNLLVEAFESLSGPDRPAGTLRQERLALGIDQPELDAVALWSVRCGDGTVAIPFIEYILAQAGEAASTFGAAESQGHLALCLDRLDRAIHDITPAGNQGPMLPRLEDVFLQEQEVALLCGSGGILDQVLVYCEIMCLTTSRDGASAAS